MAEHRLGRPRKNVSKNHFPGRDDKYKSRSKSLGHEVVARLGTAVGLRSNNTDFNGRRRHALDRGSHSPRDYNHHRRSHSFSPSPANSRRRHGFNDHESTDRQKWEHAIDAAIDAAAVEAFRLRREPSSWVGSRGGRVATAALSAATIDILRDKDPNKHGMLRSVESAIWGLIINRILNGPRDELRHR
ncbi:hypothetical protein F5883DRAFT_573135 [Diaporthe sp. PMI_573]|nr:hypothetical protein F5883DRAFT_573135 [Diaporthaceae sp. PMI_573]